MKTTNKIIKNKSIIKRQRGITIVALVITIIVLLILAGVGISSGKAAIDNAKMVAFSTEMKVMQAEVNGLYQKYQDGDLTVLDIGENLKGTKQEEIAFEGAGIKDKTGYKFYDAKTIEQLEINEITQELLVNVKTRQIISLYGIEKDKTKYYTIEQLPDENGMYNVKYNK